MRIHALRTTTSSCHPQQPSTSPLGTSRCEEPVLNAVKGSPKLAARGWEILRCATLALVNKPHPPAPLLHEHGPLPRLHEHGAPSPRHCDGEGEPRGHNTMFMGVGASN